MDDIEMFSKSGYLNESFRYFHLKDSRGNDGNYHYHEFEKIVVFLSGKVNYIVEGINYSLRPWDVLFINEHLIHRAVVDTSVPYERIILYIGSEFMRECSSSDTDLMQCFRSAQERGCCLMRLTGSDDMRLNSALMSLEEAVYSDEFGADVLARSRFGELMVLLNRLMMTDTTTCADMSAKSDPKVTEVLEYINNNLTADLSVEALAARSYISKYHFMRRFKELTGYTVHNYILQKRLVYAAALIRDGVPVTRAATECGFGDYSAFLRAFKKMFGTTPGKI